MRITASWATLAVVAALSHFTSGQMQSGITPVPPKPRARVVFSHSLPQLDGTGLVTTVLEVNYGPGESSRPHRHRCPVIGYVTTGSVRTQIMGQPEAIIAKGESFYEAPDVVHIVSANASQTERASFLAISICDQEAPLSADVPSKMREGAAK